jgi:ATP-dependent exoDNAse (exonuclease V) beta subunit
MMPAVAVEHVARMRPRPSGRRFGSLVHAVLAVSPLDATAAALMAIARVQGRLLGAPENEVVAAAELASQVLQHPMIQRALEADRQSACRREVPVTLTAGGTLLEGVVDLVFPHRSDWILVDFKTDDRDGFDIDVYRRQLALYAAAVARATGGRVHASILSI